MLLGLYLLVLFIGQKHLSQANHLEDIRLHFNERHEFNPHFYVPSWIVPNLRIYCYEGSLFKIERIFQSTYIELEINTDVYTQYKSDTPTSVFENYMAKHEIYDGMIQSNLQAVRHIYLPSFHSYCYALDTQVSYKLTLKRIFCDLERVAYFIIGMLIHTFAPALCKSIIWSYICAIKISCITVSLTFAFMAFHLTFWNDVKYQMQHLDTWLGICAKFRLMIDNFRMMLYNESYLFWSLLTAAICLSLRTCYTYNNIWHKNWLRFIHRWILKLIGYICIIYSTDMRLLGIIFVIVLLVLPYAVEIFKLLVNISIVCYRRLLPPKTRYLLSDEEFRTQGAYEAQRALCDLRRKAKNIAADWQTVGKLQRPQQFATFLQGGLDINQTDSNLRLPFQTQAYNIVPDNFMSPDSWQERQQQQLQQQHKDQNTDHNESQHWTEDVRANAMRQRREQLQLQGNLAWNRPQSIINSYKHRQCMHTHRHNMMQDNAIAATSTPIETTPTSATPKKNSTRRKNSRGRTLNLPTQIPNTNGESPRYNLRNIYVNPNFDPTPSNTVQRK